MRLYHVTPVWNKASILEEGICPDYAKGKRKVVWLVKRDRVQWALVHCSYRHRVPVSNFTVFEIEVPDMDLRRTKWEGVFTSANPVSVFTDVEGVRRFVALTD